MFLYQFSNLAKYPGIQHFITSRNGGVSNAPFNSLNLGYRTADNCENVLLNWKALSDATHIPLDSFVIAHQVHKGNVFTADHTSKKGAWSDPDSEIENTDAFICRENNICLIVKVADCVPILIYDPLQHVAAAIHAGWQGTVKSVTSNTVQSLIREFNCKPENLIAGIGPSIGACCYETGPEVESAVLEKWNTVKGFLIKSNVPGKSFFDLWYANRYEMIMMGVQPENIETAGICTKCNSGTYFSSRASAGVTGRFCAGIMLKQT